MVLVADPGKRTLLDFRYRTRFRAERGAHGSGANRSGRDGADCVIPVPCGTVVVEAETSAQLADLIGPGDRFVAARGGRGGYGNARFASPTDRAPTRAEPGGTGTARALALELKLLADAGLVGAPNAGKSTLLARVSAARPKIGDYPFTTLIPNLGLVRVGETGSFLLADIPGLIEGAAEGAGLGHRFLRHVERTRVLLHILELGHDPDREPLKDFDAINAELAQYDEVLSKRPQIVALGKMDVTEVREAYPALREKFAARGIELHAMSAATGEGVQALLELLWKEIRGIAPAG